MSYCFDLVLLVPNRAIEIIPESEVKRNTLLVSLLSILHQVFVNHYMFTCAVRS